MAKGKDIIFKTGDIVNHSKPEDIHTNHPDWLKRRLEWFQDLKFGFFVHFGLYTNIGALESWTLSPGDKWAAKKDPIFLNYCNGDYKKYNQYYHSQIKYFNPYKFNPNEWAEFVKNSGCKYFNITTKHHDGFCLWDSGETNYKITSKESPYQKDLIKPLYQAMRKKGIAIWTYFSKPDWSVESYWSSKYPVVDRNPNYHPKSDPKRWNKFVEFVHNQIKELMNKYGHIDCLWLDGGQVKPSNNQDIKMRELAKIARSAQPNLIIADRTVGGEFENFITPEGEIPNKPLGVPWEVCLTLADNWSWRENEKLKSEEWVIETLLKIISIGGNLLLNVGADKYGQFPQKTKDIMLKVGKFVKKYSEGIFKTRPIYPWKTENFIFTTKKDKSIIYVFIKEGSNEFKIPKEMHKYIIAKTVNNTRLKIKKNTIQTQKLKYYIGRTMIKLCK